MDSLPNSYSIYFPSGVPSVSFPLPFFKVSLHCLSLPLSFPLPLPPLPPSRSLFHHASPFFFVPCYPLPTLTKPHAIFFSTLTIYFLSPFLTSSSVVWLTEKCLICKVFLLDSSWLKMSATPPGAVGTWYSTMVKCWSCVFRYHAVVSGLRL